MHGDKGYFKCFGCGVAGDVIKFIELYDKLPFPEAVRQLATRVGLPVPETEGTKEDAEANRDREALLKTHEVAAAWFREQLGTPAGAVARRQLKEREVAEATIELLGIGYAPATRDGLKTRLIKEGFAPALLARSGLVVQRDDGTVADRFRNRMMIPIHRDNGAIVAFGGRAMESGQQPKYLNSPETPIYVKGRTLYGLHLSRAAIAKAKYAVIVEGYFDVAQALQAGISNVVASSGTALTPMQARLLKRFASKVVLSFDPDAAGQGAAARSSGLLVAEGFQVNVAMLPAGDDPDNFIRKSGGAAYQEKLRNHGNTWTTCWTEPRPNMTSRRTTAVGSFLAGCDSRCTDPGRCRARQFRRSTRSQGAYYRRGGPRRDSKSGRAPADIGRRAQAAGPRAGKTGGKRTHLGVSAQSGRGNGGAAGARQ